MRIGVVLLLLACGCRVATPPADDLQVRFSDDRSCQPDGVDTIRISALGDFPASTMGTVAQYNPAMAPARFDGFPIATALLDAETQTRIGDAVVGFAGSRQVVPTGTTGSLLLLPSDGRPCALADDRVVLADGMSVVALPDGGALFVGGVIAGGVQSQVLRLDAGATTATLLAARDGLAGPRTAAATALGATRDGQPLVVVAGGRNATAALSSVEIYDVAARRFDATRCPGLALEIPRMHAGAGGLPDGRVLVAGGEDLAGHAIGNAELVDPTRCTTTRFNMPAFVVAPWVGTLDDGTVIVAGGDLDSLTIRSPNTYVWVFDPEGMELASYPEDVEFRQLDQAVVVPLPGARLAHVGLGHGTDVLQVEILYTTGTPTTDTIDFGVGTPPSFTRVAAAALPDGALLVAGADAAMHSVAYVGELAVEDPPTRTLVRTLTSQPATVRTTELVSLADGVVLELSPEAASLRRTSNRTPFDNPANLVGLFLADIRLDDVALDDATHWNIAGATLVAQPPMSGTVARLDAAPLRYGNARITVDVSGTAMLLLSAPGLTTKTLSITDTRVSLAGCSAGVDRSSGATVTVDRIGDTLLLAAGGATATCAATFGGERFSLSLSATSGAVLTTLRVERLPND